MPRFIIDRLEGEFAVCEKDDLTFVNIPLKALPENAKEGDCIIIDIDSDFTKARKKRIENLAKELFE